MTLQDIMSQKNYQNLERELEQPPTDKNSIKKTPLEAHIKRNLTVYMVVQDRNKFTKQTK